MQNIIEIKNGIPRHPNFRMKESVNLTIGQGEQIAIVGPNGAGKTRLVEILTGRWPLLMNEVKYAFPSNRGGLVSDRIKYITFRDSYGDSDANYYYQQRWNSQDMEITPMVRDLLPEAKDVEWKAKLFDLFDVEPMLDKHIVLLSSGELRKFQLVKILLGCPDLLIMDNPFIGLDVKTRTMLADLIQSLIEQMGLQVILVLSRVKDIPEFITHVVPVADLACGEKVPVEVFLNQQKEVPAQGLTDEMREAVLGLAPQGDCPLSDEILKLNKVSIRYGEHVLLKDLEWCVRKGEKWALSGDNGSGKSTLLSLVCADNPQSYACDISLFGRKRGTGESIWDIKKHIGYVSPEMHRAYLKNIPAIDIVASGLHDSIGLYKRPRPEQRCVCEWWMDVFGILSLKDRDFLQLSSGEQRMVLLARAFVKDPSLLILDEPLHGLDDAHSRLVNEVIEAFCKRPDKTLIIVTHYQEELPEGITHHIYLKKN